MHLGCAASDFDLLPQRKVEDYGSLSVSTRAAQWHPLADLAQHRRLPDHKDAHSVQPVATSV